MHANSIASLCIHRNATQIGVSQLKFGTFLALHSICMITTASYASNRDYFNEFRWGTCSEQPASNSNRMQILWAYNTTLKKIWQAPVTWISISRL